jgi:hypothetical protein
VCFLQNEMRNLTGAVEGRLRNRVQKTAGSGKLVKDSRTGRGLSLDSLLPRGSSQNMFPKPSLCTTVNSTCQPLYLLAKTAITRIDPTIIPREGFE